MQYRYKIIYNINKDMWNWRDSIKDSFMGQGWIDNISDKKDHQVALRIKGLKKQPAEEILKPYLQAKKNDPNSNLNKFVNILEIDLHNKFIDACKMLEKITKHPMMSNVFTFYITTFPRMPFFYDKCSIFMYDATGGYWGMPIDGFLHEGLHFQFIHYWKGDKLSPVSKLNENEFDYLKEALTIVLDEDLKPLATIVDSGYLSQQEFRKLLHKNWQEHHDFDKLVDYGLQNLKKFMNI